jgi:hypothetical protein
MPLFMADPHVPVPALLVIAVFSRNEDAAAWARPRLEQLFGPIGLVSSPYVFDQTTYYEAQMGPDLRKHFLVFDRLVPPDCLADVKLQTNALECDLALTGRYSEARPLNLDPGLLVLGKFMLATTKDQSHRVYLRNGIFAEVTLRYHAGAFEPWPWTYADYRLPCVHEFLQQARDFYRDRLTKGMRDEA